MYLVVQGTTECRPCRKAREHAKEGPVFLLRPTLISEETGMKILYCRCAGREVHEKSISVCVGVAKGKHPVEVIEATFSTFTEGSHCGGPQDPGADLCPESETDRTTGNPEPIPSTAFIPSEPRTNLSTACNASVWTCNW
jgi:hypothetical protein